MMATAVEGTAQLVFLSARQTANLRPEPNIGDQTLTPTFFCDANFSTSNPHSYHTMASGTLTNGYTNGDSIPHQKEKNLPGGGNWVVQKFGGTSVGKFALNIADIVQ